VLANVQPGSGNPTIPPLILRAKQIREAINYKAGVTDADVSNFFDGAQDVVVADDNLLEGDELEVTDAVDVVAVVEEEPAQPMDVPAIVTATTTTAATNATVVGRPPIVLPLLHQWPAVRPELNTTSSFRQLSLLLTPLLMPSLLFFSSVRWLKSLSGGNATWNERRKELGVRKSFMR
jgi:hypothetical protein